jgi:excisionase family DNA binding protein
MQSLADNARALTAIADSLARIADHLAPEPNTIVGTPYVARLLGCTTTWVSEMIRDGRIPAACIVTGTGNGKPWKFHRDKIDEWLANR